MVLRVAVRPPRAPLEPPLADALFDVALSPPRLTAAAPSASLVLRVRRRLHDFVQLQVEMPPGDTSAGDVTNAAAEFLSSYRSIGESGDGDALARIRGAGMTHASERLAWQLERFLQALLTHPSPRVRSARALRRFLRGGAPYAAADAALLETVDVAHERIPAGCAAEHAVTVSAAAQLVLWRFASEGEGVAFSARFTATEQGDEQDQGGAEQDPYADPYQDASAADEGNAAESDAHALFCTPLRCAMAQYHTTYAFPAAAGAAAAVGGDTLSALIGAVGGHFVARAAGELVLEWENVDTSSVVSKALAYQVVVLPLSECANAAAYGEDDDDDASAAASAAGEEGGEASWLLELFADAPLVSVDDILREVGDEENHYSNDDGEDDAELGGGSALVGFGSGRSCGVNDRVAAGTRVQSSMGEDQNMTRALRRLEEEAAFHKQRADECEDSVLQLQEELRVVKSKLKTVQDELEISGEVYKASLETITQLEVDSKRKSAPAVDSQRSSSIMDVAVTIPSLAALASSVSASAAGDSAKGAAVSAKEHQRVVDLCTTFQEQCLWRSIELTESEKRSLALEGQLRDAVDAHAGCHERLEAREASVVALEAEVAKLKAHKAILVQEVKKLQPFSHVNLSALVQEAQEARMMQRSLQAQLDANRAAARSNNASNTSASTQSGGAANDDDEDDNEGEGVSGDFVVIESEDRS